MELKCILLLKFNSDGENVLRIENSSFVYVRTGQPFEIRYSYIDASSGATDNDGIDIRLVQDTSRPVVATGSFTYTEESTDWTGGRRGALIQGVTAPGLPDNDIYRATINIRKGVLTRAVQLQLRPAMNFFEVTSTPADGIVANNLGEPVSISFKMPVDISPHLFPIPVYITSRRFSPDVSRSRLSINVNEGSYRYVYYAPYLVDADNQPLAHTIYMVSNSPDTEEIVTLSADMFNDATVQFGNRLAFTGTSLTPASVPRLAGSPVDVGFRLPARYDWAAAGNLCTVTLHTTSLEPLDGDTTLVPVSDPIHSDGYSLTIEGPVDPNTTFTVPMRTTRADGDVCVTLAALDFDTSILVATRANWDFTASFSSKPRDNSNYNPVTLTFSLPEGSVSAESPVDITFSAPWMTLINNDDANRSPELAGGNIVSTGMGADVVMTMRITSVGPHWFRVRNSSYEGSNEQTIKTLRAAYFNEKTLNSPNGD